MSKKQLENRCSECGDPLGKHKAGRAYAHTACKKKAKKK